MTDLPYAQPIFDDDPKNNDGVNNAGTGSSFSEKQPVESSFSPEKAPTPETLKSPETVPVPKPKIQKKPGASSEIEVQKSQEKAENIVDKTNEITTLHDIKPTKDRLTIEADEEEERFIEEVEKHHGKI